MRYGDPMRSVILDEHARRNIIFDVLDGIPPSQDESVEEVEFRKEIENDSRNLEYRAEEVGISNPLFEFSSQG
tara:strand:- start:530 stop:748 length:219 start_codon:yes stop_codon:yes gene_type:complete